MVNNEIRELADMFFQAVDEKNEGLSKQVIERLSKLEKPSHSAVEGINPWKEFCLVLSAHENA